LRATSRLNIQSGLDFSWSPRVKPDRRGGKTSNRSLNESERPAKTCRVMEEVCERANLKEALRQVRGNKGSAGVDRMTVDQLGDYLKQHWPGDGQADLQVTPTPLPVKDKIIIGAAGGDRAALRCHAEAGEVFAHAKTIGIVAVVAFRQSRTFLAI
jgi:RNA-directed DNA polymerase